MEYYNKVTGLSAVAAGGVILLAAIGLGKMLKSPSRASEEIPSETVSEAEEETKNTNSSSNPSTRPPSVSPSPSATPPLNTADSLFFSILDSYSRKTPGLSSTPSPSGRKKRRNRNKKKNS